MGRKTNFAHIPVREDTKKELDKLKEKLGQYYENPSYEKLMRVFLEKNKKIVFTGNDIIKIMSKKRGVNYEI
jgi:hypothetical protein